MEYDELFKIVLEKGFTPEIKKQIEAGTYFGRDIANIMEAISAHYSLLEKKIAVLEGQTDCKKTDACQNTDSLYSKLNMPLPSLASKKEAKKAIKAVQEHHLKGTISDNAATELAKSYQSRLEDIAKNSWWHQAWSERNQDDFAGCAVISGALGGIGALVAAGIYVGSYLAAAEIGGVIGGVIPPVVCYVSDSRLSDRGPAVLGTVFGAISGIAAACIAYGAIPDIASQESMNVIGKGVLSGVAGGIAGLIASLIYTYGDDHF